MATVDEAHPARSGDLGPCLDPGCGDRIALISRLGSWGRLRQAKKGGSKAMREGSGSAAEGRLEPDPDTPGI